ncbi:MAG: hypothetical protein H6618_08625 [Deltaproteobacteria bacterium]|nr:hypothetical protein [Deltaproteobacteria bacterium]
MNILSESEWKSIVDDWQKSGLPQSEYARNNKINPNRMGYWVRKFRRKKAESDHNVNFVEIHSDQSEEVKKYHHKYPATTAKLVVMTSYGARIEVPL